MARNVKVEEPSKAVSSAALAGRLQAVEAQTKQSSERIYYVSGRDVFVSLHTGSSSLYAVLCYLLLCCATCCCVVLPAAVLCYLLLCCATCCCVVLPAAVSFVYYSLTSL